jgi:hypothetical protein
MVPNQRMAEHQCGLVAEGQGICWERALAIHDDKENSLMGNQQADWGRQRKDARGLFHLTTKPRREKSLRRGPA